MAVDWVGRSDDWMGTSTERSSVELMASLSVAPRVERSVVEKVETMGAARAGWRAA